jgi:four helix bundle protein
MKPYERLEAWQASHQLVKAIYLATHHWPKFELYGLTSQTRRAAFSIPLNIAEGSAKRGSREFRRFLDISLGSMSELSYCLRLARELEYLNDEEWEKTEAQRDKTGKLLWRLYQAMVKAKAGT